MSSQPAHAPHPSLSLTDALAGCLPGLLAPPAPLVHRLQTLMPCRALPAGQVVLVEGQVPKAFYLVAAGEIEARFIAQDGRTSTLERMHAPRLFGLAAFVTGRPSRYEAAAVEDSQVWVIATAAYEVLMDEWPGFARALMREFAQRFQGNLGLLEAARHLSAEERFEVALRQLLKERAGPPDPDGWVEVRATQLELAQSAHLSRQTVNELLKAAEASGQIRRRYGGLLVRPVETP